MKKIEAIIRPEKIDMVRNALGAIGYPGITITEVEGHGKQKGLVQQWRGKEYRLELLQKVKIEVVVKDADVERIVKVIMDKARTDKIGDGKIFVYPIENVFRIRTGEKGESAL
ncbi:MAG: P-II family nitrogen regulator [Candidatus Omnitrophota bacterium]